MKIFFDILHSHFRKLVGAALLTAMAGALYGLGTTLTAQTFQPTLQKRLAESGVTFKATPQLSQTRIRVTKDSIGEIYTNTSTGEKGRSIQSVLPTVRSTELGLVGCHTECNRLEYDDNGDGSPDRSSNWCSDVCDGGSAPVDTGSHRGNEGQRIEPTQTVSTSTAPAPTSAPAPAVAARIQATIAALSGVPPAATAVPVVTSKPGDPTPIPKSPPAGTGCGQSCPPTGQWTTVNGEMWACFNWGCAQWVGNGWINSSSSNGPPTLDGSNNTVKLIGGALRSYQYPPDIATRTDASGKKYTIQYSVDSNGNITVIVACVDTGCNPPAGQAEIYEGCGGQPCYPGGPFVPKKVTIVPVPAGTHTGRVIGSITVPGNFQIDASCLGSDAKDGKCTADPGSRAGTTSGSSITPAASVSSSAASNPTATSPGPSNTPVPTKVPCNATCTTSDQCAAGLSCINIICPSPAAGQVACQAIDMRCRMPSNPSSATCDGYATPTVTPVPTATITPGGPTLTPTYTPTPTLTPTPPSSYIVSKYQSGVAKDGGSYVVSFAFTVRNTGSIDLSDITLVDTLPQKKPEFANPQVISLTTFPDGLLVLNGEYDGVTKTSILATGSKLRTGESAGVILAVRYTPSAKEYTCDGKYDFINKVDSQAAASTGAKLSQSSSVSFTIQQDACAPKVDLVITKEAASKTYITGNEITYYLNVTNQGKVNATNVAIRDYLKQIEPYFLLNWPSNVVKCVASVGQPNVAVPICIEGAGNIDFYIGDLAAGGSRTVTLKGKTLKGGSFTNITEIIRANEIDVDSAPSNCVADGQIVKKEDDCDSVVLSGVEPTPTPTIPGNPFTFVKKMVAAVPQTDGTTNISYLITAKNTKPISVTLSTVIDQIAQNDAGYSYTVIPASLMAVGATDQVNKSFNGKDNVNLLSLTQPLTLTAGGTDKSYVSVAYTIRVTPKSASVVRLCNEATLKGDIDGTQFTLVSATKDDNCTPIQQGALEIKKSASPQSVRLGESTVYTIELSNPSKATVADVSVEDILNSGIQYKEFLGIIATGGATSTSSTQVVSNDKTKILFGTYTLPGGSSVVLKFSATAAGECAKIYQNNVKAIRIVGSSQTVLAEYTQTTAEDVIVQCTSVASTPTPTPAPSTQYDVELSKTADKQTVKLGDIVTFTVTVHNQAVNTMLSLKVKDQLPASLQYMGHETSYGTYNNLDGIWTIGNLNPDQRQTLKLVARVAGRDDLKNFAEVYAHEQKDIDSTPNNGRNGEDDNAQVELKLDDVFIAGPTKGGMLADTGYGVMVPLIAGMLFFLSLIALAEAHPNHKLVIRIVNPAHGASGLSFPKLRFMIMGTVVATGIAFAVSGLTFTQVVLQARVRLQQQYEYLQELRLVDATAATDKRNVELKCGVIIEPAYTFAEKSPVGFKITNTTDAPAVFAIPGIDVIQSVAGKSEVTIPSGTASLSFPSAGTWHIINPVYCPGSTTLGVSKVTVEGAVVTPTPTTTLSGTPVPSTALSQAPTPSARATVTPTFTPTPIPPTPTPTVPTTCSPGDVVCGSVSKSYQCGCYERECCRDTAHGCCSGTYTSCSTCYYNPTSLICNIPTAASNGNKRTVNTGVNGCIATMTCTAGKWVAGTECMNLKK